MPRAPIFLSIIIPAHNNHRELQTLLASIQQSTFSNFSETEIVVVDDGSHDDIEKQMNLTVKKLPSSLIVYRLQSNKGPAYARNYGVSKARGKYIVFLDADVVVKKNTLQNAFDFFKKKKGLAFTGIWSHVQKTKAFFPQFKALRDHSYWFIERELNARYYLFSTRIAGIEKKLFQEIGQFKTTFKKPTVEDIELTYRIEQKTKIHFEPDIVVKHEFEDFIPIAKKYFARSRDWIKLYIKRLRFDPVATSKTEAKKSVYSGLSVLFFLLFIVTQYIVFLYLVLVSIVIFLAFEYKFLRFLLKKKGPIFALKSIVTAYILYLIIDLGTAFGAFEYYVLRKR